MYNKGIEEVLLIIRHAQYPSKNVCGISKNVMVS